MSPPKRTWNISASAAVSSAALAPVSATEFERAFHTALPLPPDLQLAVAVSGGADSMALLILLADYATRHNITLHALTIDHRLREASRHEAATVGKWCATMSIAHTILDWQHEPIASGMPEKAREARYRLMTAWCLKHGIRHLATAHQADDQTETFLMRLLRGSGMEGLAGTLPFSIRQGVFLCRPLLSFHKSRLEETLRQHGQPWIDDPSNRNTSYTRNAFRHMLRHVDEAQLTRISHLTNFFYELRIILDNNVTKSVNYCFSSDEAGYGTLDARRFMEQPAELKPRIATHLCTLISGDATPPRSEKIDRLVATLQHPNANQKITLHGVVFRYQQQSGAWLLTREIKHLAPPRPLEPWPLLWDGRFIITPVAGRVEACRISALGNAYLAHAKALAASPIPKSAWPTLPAIFHLEECIAIPHIAWKKDSGVAPDVQVEFVPAKILADERTSAMNQEEKHDKGEGARAKFR